MEKGYKELALVLLNNVIYVLGESDEYESLIYPKVSARLPAAAHEPRIGVAREQQKITA